MDKFELEIPGTAGVYDGWYANPTQSPIYLQSGDTPTTGLEWYYRQGFPSPDTILYAGCGAGRNLPKIEDLFPNAAIYGFDGSPTGVDRAKAACPRAVILQGNLFESWPFANCQYDLVASITSISPESATSEQLRAAGRYALDALKPHGYWLDEGIDPDDEVAKRFPLVSNADAEKGAGQVVLWRYGEQTKPERVISLPDAISLYRSLGALVAAARIVVFEDAVFGLGKSVRRFIQCILQKPPEGETAPLSPLTPAEGYVAPGLTNEICLVADSKGEKYVQKTVRHGPDGAEGLMQRLSTEELVEIGFIRPGVAISDAVVYDRTNLEQRVLCERLDSLGIPVAVPAYADPETLITPLIAGQTLWEHLQDGKTSAIIPALQSLYQTHMHATYGGEPWAGNFVVTDDETSVVRIDFEVAIAGRTAAELEMAQLLYAVLGLTTNFDACSAKVASFISEHTEHYDWDQVYAYISAYERYFSEHPNGQRMGRAKYRLGERLVWIAQILTQPDGSY